MNEVELINNIDELISKIKKSINDAGIDKDSSEFQIVTEIFLYKFLNDKFKYESKKVNNKLKNATNWDEAYASLTDDEYNELIINISSDCAVINKNQTIPFFIRKENILTKMAIILLGFLTKL